MATVPSPLEPQPLAHPESPFAVVEERPKQAKAAREKNRTPAQCVLAVAAALAVTLVGLDRALLASQGDAKPHGNPRQLQQYAKAFADSPWKIETDKFPKLRWAAAVFTGQDVVEMGGFDVRALRNPNMTRVPGSKTGVRYNLETGKMEPMPEYEYGKAGHQLLSLGGMVISIAGTHTNKPFDISLSSLIEVLTNNRTEWQEKKRLYTGGIKEFSAVVVDDVLYVIGGCSGVSDRQEIERYRLPYFARITKTVLMDKNISSSSAAIVVGKDIYIFPGREQSLKGTSIGYDRDILKLDTTQAKPIPERVGCSDRPLSGYTMVLDPGSGYALRFGGWYLPGSYAGLFLNGSPKNKRPRNRANDRYLRSAYVWSHKKLNTFQFAGKVPGRGALIDPLVFFHKGKGYVLDKEGGTLYSKKLPDFKAVTKGAAAPVGPPSAEEARKLLERAEGFWAKGLKKRAAVIYKIIVKNYPKSGAGVRAAERLKELE